MLLSRLLALVPAALLSPLAAGLSPLAAGLSPLAAGLSPLTAGAIAGQVLTVDDSGGADFIRIQDAVQAAADGDTILVRTGSYDGFTVVGRTLAVVAEDGAVVDVLGGVNLFDQLPDQELLVVGLRVQGSNGRPALTIENCAGSVVVDDSLFIGPPSAPEPWLGTAALVTRSVAVSISDSLFYGSDSPSDTASQAAGAGLAARDANLHLSDVVLRGGAGADAVGSLPAERGGHGLELITTTLNAIGSKAFGGDGGRGQVLASSCAGGAGGAGVSALASVSTHRAFETVGGRGGLGALAPGGGCPKGADGLPWSLTGGKLLELAGPSRGLDASPSPVRGGQALTITVRGAAGDLAVLAFSTSPEFTRLPGLEGLRLVGDPLEILPLGLLPAGGSTTFDVPAPALPPATSQLTLHLQLATARVGSTGILGESDTLIVLGQGL